MKKRSPIKRRKGVSGPARGRPQGSIRRLFDDPDRFRVAFYVAATECLGLGKYQASYLATLVMLSSNVMAETVQEDFVRVSANPGHRTHEADKGFVRKVARLTGQLDPIESDWLAVSASHLAVLLTQGSMPAAIDFAINRLVAYGWRETLLNVVDRLQCVLHSNLPPATTSLSKRVERLLRTRIAEVRPPDQ